MFKWLFNKLYLLQGALEFQYKRQFAEVWGTEECTTYNQMNILLTTFFLWKSIGVCEDCTTPLEDSKELCLLQEGCKNYYFHFG